MVVMKSRKQWDGHSFIHFQSSKVPEDNFPGLCASMLVHVNKTQKKVNSRTQQNTTRLDSCAACAGGEWRGCVFGEEVVQRLDLLAQGVPLL